MKTTPPAQLANVVNASVTMFFHSVQRLTAAPTGGGLPGGRTRALCLRARPAVSIPPSTLFIWPANALAITSSRPSCFGLFRLQAPALTAQLSDARLLILGIKGKNRSHAARLGACRRRRARRQRGVAHRGIGLGRRRPRLGGGARDRRAPIRSRPRPSRKSTAFRASRGRPSTAA